MVTAVQEDVAYEERLKGLLKFNLKKKKQSANRIAVFRYTYSSGIRKGMIYTSCEWQTLVKLTGLNYSKGESCQLLGKLVVRLIQH